MPSNPLENANESSYTPPTPFVDLVNQVIEAMLSDAMVTAQISAVGIKSLGACIAGDGILDPAQLIAAAGKGGAPDETT